MIICISRKQSSEELKSIFQLLMIFLNKQKGKQLGNQLQRHKIQLASEKMNLKIQKFKVAAKFRKHKINLNRLQFLSLLT